MENRGIEYTLEEHLKYLCEENYQYRGLIATWEMDKKVYKDMLQAVAYNFPHYSMHESSHSKSIISNIEMVLGEGRIKLLGPTETWMILESAYLHDFGMILQNEYVEDIWKSNLFQEFLKESCKFADKDLQEAAYYILNLKESISKEKSNKDWPVKVRRYVVEIIAAYFRADHPKRSMDYINAFDKNLKFDLTHGNLIKARLIKLIGKVAFLHGQSFEEVKELKYKSVGLKSDYIHPRFIAEMIRLGDVLDIDNGRFNEILIRVFGKLPEMSKIHFKKHGDITHILISPTAIEVTADCSDDDEIRETRKWFDWIKDEIRNITVDWMDIVPENFEGYPPKIRSLKIFKNGKADEGISDLKLEIPRQRMFEILEGSGIYKNKIDFLRELIQNALDASKIQLWRDLKSGMYDPWIKNDVELKDLTPFDIDKAVYESYKVIIKIESIKDDNEKIRIKVIDRGIGISKDNLKNMSCVGKSWDKRDKFKDELKDMPLWLKPTGGFGIGIQSCFMVSDEIYIKTKTDEDRINVREIKIESGKENGYITSEIHENENFKRGSEVILYVPKDLNFKYNIPSDFLDKLMYYDLFNDKDEIIVWVIEDYIFNMLKFPLIGIRFKYNKEINQKISCKSFVGEYGGFFSGDKYYSNNNYLLAFDSNDFNIVYLWDKKLNSFIKLDIKMNKDVKSMNKAYFKGIKVEVPNNIIESDLYFIVFDMYNGDVSEMLTLDRQNLKEDAKKIVDNMIENAFKFILKKYNDEIENDNEFIKKYKVNALTLRLMNDIYNMGSKIVNDILVQNCDQEIVGFVRNDDALYEYKKIPIKDVLRHKEFGIIDLSMHNFTNNKTIQSIREGINNSLNLSYKYILAPNHFTEVVQRYNNSFDLREIKDVIISIFSNTFDKKVITKVSFYKIFSKDNSQIISVENRNKILLNIINLDLKRSVIEFIDGYDNLGIKILPTALRIQCRHKVKFIVPQNILIISPITREDSERIKDKSKSFDTIKKEIKNRDDFRKLVDYVYENRINNETTKEDIVEDYMKLIDEYYGVVRNK